MRIVKPLVLIETAIDSEAWMKKLEYYVRKCYKSEDKITATSYDQFIRRVFRTMKHEGVIEHFSVSVTVVTDRGVSHEQVRHRIAAYLQESTRYCDYSVDGKNHGVTFVLPHNMTPSSDTWSPFLTTCHLEESIYNLWRDQHKWSPQEARFWLPNGTKTEYVATFNLRSWYNFFRLRTAPQAHPMMRQIAIPTLRYFIDKLPIIYDGFEVPAFPYEEARLVEHPGTEPVAYEEVYSD